jgi:hypothetical protein
MAKIHHIIDMQMEKQRQLLKLILKKDVKENRNNGKRP